MASKRISELPAATALDGTEQIPLTQAGETRRILGDTYRPKRVVDMPMDYGVHPDEAAATNGEGIDQAISDAAADGASTVVLAFTSGAHDIDRTVGYDASADTDIGLHLQGQGRRGTSLVQADDTLDVMAFTNTVQNLRGITMDDLWLRGGRRALFLRRVWYSLFRNVVSHQQVVGDFGAVAWDGPSSMNTFQNCWWVHTDPTDALRGDGGGSQFVDGCIIGEDVGGISVGAGGLYVVNSGIHTAGAKLVSGDSGPGGLGSYGVYARDDSTVSLAHCLFKQTTGLDQFLVTLRPQHVSLYDVGVQMEGCDVLWSNYRATGAGSVKMRDSWFEFFDDGAATKTITREESVGTADIINALMDGNTILKPSTKALQMDDAWFDASRDNTMGDNKVLNK